MKKYKVLLSAHGNPDYNQNPYEKICPCYYAESDSIEQCQKLVSKYIAEYNLGGGNWTGGKVIETSKNTHIGDISYNCRFWPAHQKLNQRTLYARPL